MRTITTGSRSPGPEVSKPPACPLSAGRISPVLLTTTTTTTTTLPRDSITEVSQSSGSAPSRDMAVYKDIDLMNAICNSRAVDSLCYWAPHQSGVGPSPLRPSHLSTVHLVRIYG
ncbi:hypothetical protein E2P81_ATG02353 [Venturia nashicola]|uniref:Uncharacterized protein n=1 Tax=Venturia nashicola TaxID=86259 RepID=A0A4Z1P520_9PEZI|nr:hypothetical protein E6O75_ATG02412 [Venturia nashicola]TLD36571.1 hypothetical protein E2P81_ATG02353 [Venturia nashicola]